MLVRHNPGTEHHAQGKFDLNGFLRAILAARAAMPAFFRIFDPGFVFLRVHINDIKGAAVFAGSATGAEFAINYGRHRLYSFRS
jgi:hypothetical protein